MKEISVAGYEPDVINENDLDLKNEEGDIVEIPFTEIKSGNYFGDLALIDNNRRIYSLWAMQNSHIFYFEKNDFKEMIKK